MILLLQIFSCFFMTGVIWLVQILVYPSFRVVDPMAFQNFHHFHTNRITWIVAPAMGVELATGIWLCVTHTNPTYVWNLTSILAAWILTGLVSVPIHRKLELNSTANKDGLIWTNWPRTLLWSTRSLFWLWFLFQKISLGPL